MSVQRKSEVGAPGPPDPTTCQNILYGWSNSFLFFFSFLMSRKDFRCFSSFGMVHSNDWILAEAELLGDLDESLLEDVYSSLLIGLFLFRLLVTLDFLKSNCFTKTLF